MTIKERVIVGVILTLGFVGIFTETLGFLHGISN